ncbi:methylene-tetrahydromethanopterin dehydrogenase N-terminal domain-containing protein [Mariniblastus fucicola]|uniref:Bifunctional protein MdtA n=1 Tax=Mariniblastus fucicola TaxID=980251 RepID=A0A5B9PBI3_9BACT|nr:methylene-tetrahydromethanopterin dehydrogenase N-terminal domain-containing protein [Mariniblastus fucicola]QEG22565.1 Bifunctional protein MdtA [Mariniblastus fucicola]
MTANSKKRILVQIDPDAHPSVFDSVVAIDSGVEQLLTHGAVSEDDVTGLVHGCIFTRSIDDLRSTALFFGGSNVDRTEALVEKAKSAFFGPMRVSLMSDPNGCNTTAAAAVLSAGKHVSWDGLTVTILAATGPVGIRIAQILAKEADASNETVTIRICSRKLQRAEEVCRRIAVAGADGVTLEPLETAEAKDALPAVDGSDVVFAAGAAGIELLPEGWLEKAPKVVVDVNAVPPAGIHGVEVMDKAETRGETICYGAIGVGGLKMKIHRKCIESLFESNDSVLEVHQIHAIGKTIVG